jgi:hypothetical protein
VKRQRDKFEIEDVERLTHSLMHTGVMGPNSGADPGFEHRGGEEDITTKNIIRI